MWGFKSGGHLPNMGDYNVIYPKDIEPLVEKHPELYEIWDKIPNWVTKCDIARYLFLYYNVGTYLDMDCVKQKDIPKDILNSANIVLYTEHIGVPTGPREDKSITLRVANYAMTSIKPLQKFWLECIDESVRRVKSILDIEWTDKDVLWSAGPGMVSEVYHNLEDKSGITVLDDTHVTHHATGSWRTHKPTSKYKYGIVLCCHNRPGYLKTTLDSLSNSNLKDSIICIVDDFSDDKITINLIKNFDIPGVKIIKITNKKNLGISLSLLEGFNQVFPLCTYMVNIDSDTIVKRDWLSTLEKTYNSYNKLFSNKVIVTGFNCIDSCSHKIIKEFDDFYIKKSFGGINNFYHKDLFYIYKKILNTGISWDWNLVDYCNENNITLIATKPSTIQHTGVSGMNSNGRYDYAEDFGLIPKTIMQTCASKDKLTPQMVNAMRTWRDKNPGWDYELFDNNECVEFIKKYFNNDTLKAFNNLIPGAFKADLFRYCYLYIKGGVYSDIDNICLVPLNSFLRDDDTFVSVKDRMVDGQDLIYNAFIAVEKNHPVLKKAIDLTVHNVLNDMYPNTGSDTINMLSISGPKCLAAALDSCKGIKFRLLDIVEKGIHITHIKTNSGKMVVQVKYDGYKVENDYWDLFAKRQVYKNQAPLISCLCPTKNKPSIVKDAIECFNNQTYPNKELILVTNDKNPHLSYLETLVCDNVKLVFAPQETVLGELRNISVDNASGEYVAIWDDDDIHHKDRLQMQFDVLAKSKGKEACFLRRVLFHDINSGDKGILKEWWGNEASMLALKSAMPRYDDALAIAEDTPVKVFFLKRGKGMIIQQPQLYVYRFHGNNTCEQRHLRDTIDTII